MKSALLGLVLGLGFALLAVTGSCSVNHRSDAYACTKQSDCVNGRTCSPDGWCVLPGGADGPRLDAPKGNGDGGNCPPGCTSCDVAAKTCTVDCGLTSCSNTITCPSGYKCNILCNTSNSCRNGVDCSKSASCTITCSGQQACQDVQCGAGPCDLMCSGPSSCKNVSCGNSCACDISCTGNQSCGDTVQCTSTACKSLGSGCTSVPAFCHSCP